MKTTWLIPALLLLSANGWAQAGALYNAQVSENTSLSNPAEAMTLAEGQWLAFSLPALTDTRSPCCWTGKWDGVGEVGCNLETPQQSNGTRSDSPMTENLIVINRIRGGKVDRIQVVGESCPVDANGAQVIWIGSVDETAGLEWLENAARSQQDSKADAALLAIALHRSPAADKVLYNLAREARGEQAEEAIFWLGESRGERGFETLRQLLAELPQGDTRRQINFALAQNQTPAAVDLLFVISKSDPDPEQRGEAMFWLAQNYPRQAQDWLLEVIRTEQEADVLDQAVFAISQLPGDSGDRVLLELARDAQSPRAVRRQALFWLAQSDNDASIAALTDLLSR